MSTLTIHGRELPTGFDLLGTKENDLSYGLGWVLAQCPPFINAVVHALTGQTIDVDTIDGDFRLLAEEWPGLAQEAMEAERFAHTAPIPL